MQQYYPNLGKLQDGVACELEMRSCSSTPKIQIINMVILSWDLARREARSTQCMNLLI